MSTYYRDTAKAITDVAMNLADERVGKDDRKHHLEFFRYSEKGIWPTNQFDSDSAVGQSLKWKPCHEFDRASGLNLSTTPGLPFPFTECQLAAFMLHGVGTLVADAFGDWDDGPMEQRLELLKEDWDRSAIEGAFNAYREAFKIVGPYDATYSERIQELERQCGPWLDVQEARKRVRQAHLDADEYESDRRKKMVNQLLKVSHVGAASDSPEPLTTSQIVGCFNGFHGWDADKWKKNLQSPAPWLKKCLHRAGNQGKPIVESTWWPVQIAAALDKKHPNIKRKLHARFKNQEPLKPWLESLEANLPDDSKT
jgi:hypothetical protein